MLTSLAYCVLVALTLGLQAVTGKTVHIYVSPRGTDSHSGLDVHHPVKTLQKAKQILDQPSITGNTVYVELLAGYYDLSSSLHFTHGYPSPVTFRSYQGQEVHVTGGRRLATNLFEPVKDQSLLIEWTKEAQRNIRQIHLPAAGITDYGELSPFGWYVYRQAPLELFINGQPLTLARWPNHDFIDITSVKSRYGREFSHASSRDSRWVKEKEPWAYGYWYWSWGDYAVKITHIDSTSHSITLQNKTLHGMRTGEYRTVNLTVFGHQGGYFRVFNMLSELDEPGEYYIDRSTGILYVWPNTKTGALTSSDIVYASMINDCITLDSGVFNLRFEDFALEACRHFGIKAESVKNVQLQQLEMKNTGSYVFHCGGDCRSVTVSRCEIHDGDGGIDIFGGDRVTLTPSGNVIEDNHIWRYSREGAVGQNAVHSVGVNNLIRYNHIHDGQYAAVKFDGNDHIMEYNHVHHNCMNASDCGAFHATRSWSFRGNFVRYNHIHHTLRRVPGAPVRGVMLDDQYSSVTIEHNVFYHNEIHANIGGGRDNIIRYNVMYNATAESMQVDGRGASSQFDYRNRTLQADLSNIPYTNALWTARYPELANINSGVPRYPEGNQIFKNIVWNEKGKQLLLYTQMRFADNKYFDVHDNHQVHKTPDIYAPEQYDFRLRCATKQWADGANFESPVSLQHVGPRYSTGPTYLHTALPTYPSTHKPQPCDTSTVAPATTVPETPYVPDGSGPNKLYPNITEGCWFISDDCPNHPGLPTIQRDTWGEQHQHAGTDESSCLGRASKQWTYCGSSQSHGVTAVYGPTGAMTIGGYGCYMAFEKCPRHPGAGGIRRDTYAEHTQNGTTDMEGCLSRARAQWGYCGSYPEYPVTSIFGPTGTTTTAGAGCWVKVTSCPADKTIGQFFYDSWGATNLDTDHDEDQCFQRADFYWQHCGTHRQFPVTAFYRPMAINRTVPHTSGD